MSRHLLLLLLASVPLVAGPFSLREARERLLKNNLDILAAEAELRKVEAELVETRAAWWPSLDASASYTLLSEKNRIRFAVPAAGMSIDTTIGRYDRTEFGIDCTYPVFTGFSRHFAVRSKQEYAESKKAMLESTINRITLSLGLLYLQWELSYKQADVRRALIERLESYVRQVTAMHEAGTALRSKRLEAEARLKLAHVDLGDAEDRTDSLRRELMSLVLCKDEEIFPDTTSTAFDTLPIPKRALVDTARPELVMLAHAGAQIEQMRNSLKYRHFPSLVGIAGYRYANPGLGMGSTTFMGYGLAGLQLQWNLFDGLKVRAQHEQFTRQLDLIDIERTRRIETLERTSVIAHEQVNNAAERLVATMASREAAQALADDLKNSLEAGVVTAADYLDALVNLAEADLRVEQAKTAKKMAMQQLFFAMGKDLEY
ncbi:MAG: TolC family protein [Chitinispirillaceae bacterium]|nr:TolC family protein [Chitinispirillaceae bacterium]